MCRLHLLTFLLVTIAICRCSSSPTVGFETSLSANIDESIDFAHSNRVFAAAVYKELARSESETVNFLTCPLSVQTVMALTSTGAKGDTSAQITRGLSLPSSKSSIKQIFKQLTPQLRGNEYYSLTSANKLFVQHSFKLNKDYQAIAQDVFDADVDSVDFAQNIEAADGINQWVQQKTNSKIQQIVAAEDLSADTKMVLANALHFKGKWATPFDPLDTIKSPFYNPASSSGKEPLNVDMMQLTDSFNYYENKELDAKFLELPYIGGDMSMVFVLPNKINGLPKLESHMEDVLKEQPFVKQHVRIQLPKFSMETSTKYKPILQKLGIQKVFTPDADLTGISPSGNLLINSVIQKTFINVTETGTEAAAATAGTVIGLSIPSPIRMPTIHFVADHPFFFYLNYASTFKNSNEQDKPPMVLFMGRFEMPALH